MSNEFNHSYKNHYKQLRLSDEALKKSAEELRRMKQSILHLDAFNHRARAFLEKEAPVLGGAFALSFKMKDVSMEE